MAQMLRDIGAELGRPIAWEQANLPVRSYVTTTPGGRIETKKLIESATAELHAVDQLHRTRVLGTRDPSADVGDDFCEQEEDTPEERLVALWAMRRLKNLTDYRQLLDKACASHIAALKVYARNPKRAEDHEEALRNAKAELARAVRLVARIRGVAEQYAGVRASFELMPSMQRDHRLRRLLAAFAPATREWITDQEGRLSTLPPLKAPDFFELWGAVKLVESLRSLGWTVGSPTIHGTAEDWGLAGVDACQWEATRGDERLIFDFGPRPELIDIDAIPELHERSVDSWVWGAQQLPTDFMGLCSIAPSTPDYALRWSSAAGRVALAIGDASLADPEHQKGDKIRDTVKYRREFAWRISEAQLVNCAPTGSFLVLPGPSEQWPASVTSLAAKQDCYLLCPTPGANPDNFTARVESLIQSLRHSRL
jgi:hypothetical protein